MFFCAQGKDENMNRVQKIIAQAKLGENEAIILSKPSNIFYASGYTGEGFALISHNISAIVTDFRYTEQATKQAPCFTPYEIKTGLSHEQLAYQVLKDAGIQQVRYEDDQVTVAGFEKIKQAMPEMTFSPLHGAVEIVRQIKDDAEIEIIKKACAISDAAFEFIKGEIKEGMTEMDLRIALEFKMLKLGAQGFAFDTIIASGENGSLCHAIPGQRKLQKGDMITMDFGARFAGYCSDMTRTVALGEPNEKMRNIYNTVLKAQISSQEAVIAGIKGCEVDKIARDIIDEAGYQGCFGHGLGHSLGIDVHEAPNFNSRSEAIMREGMIMTVEPGIYIAGLGGVRIENTVLVLNDGVCSLTQSPKDLVIL